METQIRKKTQELHAELVKCIKQNLVSGNFEIMNIYGGPYNRNVYDLNVDGMSIHLSVDFLGNNISFDPGCGYGPYLNEAETRKVISFIKSGGIKMAIDFKVNQIRAHEEELKSLRMLYDQSIDRNASEDNNKVING